MRYTAKQYAEALYGSLREAHAGTFSLHAKQFVALLKKEGALKLLPQILNKLELLEREHTGRKLVRVSSAGPMSEKALAELKSIFQKSEIREAYDKNLVGGLIVEWDDFRVDGSVRGRLAKLRSSLSS